MFPKKKVENKNKEKSKEKKRLFQYDPEQVANALAAIRDTGMKVATACKLYEVPRSTIRNKLEGKAPDTTGKVGRSPVLGRDVENKLIEWIKNISKMGFPIGKEGLVYSVKKLVEEANLSTPFTNNTPGRKWFNLFMARHPEISRKQSEYINRARSLITENHIRGWFQETLELLGEHKNILDDPARLWNMDETSIYLCPKGGLVLAEKGLPVYDTSANSDKENITTLFAVNAVGQFANPLTIYKYDRLPEKIAKSAPPNWGIGKSPKGWMNSSCFYEYFSNVFIPYLQDTKATLPVIVFLDGHSSHLSLPLSKLCIEKQIILVCLYPNTTHILQPLDVSFFFPLKSKWRSTVKMFMMEHERDIKKFDIPNVLKNIIEKIDFKSTIINGFRKCGLFPFSADNVDYSKCITTIAGLPQNQQNINLNVVNKEILSHLNYLESKIDVNILSGFKNFHYTETTKSLYEVWIIFKHDDASNATSTDLIQDSYDNDIIETQEVANNLTQENQIHTEDEVLEFAFPEFETNNNILHVGSVQDLLNVVDEPDITEPELPPERVQDSINPSTSTPVEEVYLKSPCLQKPPTLGNIVVTPKRKVVDILNEIIFYPPSNDSKKKKILHRMPSVITSSKWIEIAEAKEYAKEKENREKSQRRQERLDRKKHLDANQNSKKNKKNRSQDKEEKMQESETAPEVSQKVESINTKRHENDLSTKHSEEETQLENIKTQKYIIVQYENRYYPGTITEENSSSVLVSTMERSGTDWKWPVQKDEIWYFKTDIMEEIDSPVKKNSRGVYTIHEMNKYKNFF